MNDEEINTAIAEVCGWKEVEPWLNGNRCFELNQSVCGYRIEDLPDYCNCLNAMHKAEKIFKGGMRNTYDANLIIISERDYCFVWEMSARQRAEAFLKTVGKWEE